jgi:phage terminase small subunit
MGELTPKQQRFVDEYLVDLNATQAAIRAGYSPKTARQQGHENLTKPYIEAAIQRAVQERSERTRVEADRVVLELARLGLYDPRGVAEWGPDGIRVKDSSGLSDDDVRIVARIRMAPTKYGWAITVKFVDRLSALELLGKHLGLFSDGNAVRGQVQEPIRIIEVNRVEREDAGAD